MICARVIPDNLERMQIGQQIVQLLVVENARKRWHHVLAVENSATDLRIRCRSTAGKMRLMKQPPQTGPHQFLIAVGIVTGRTIALEDRLSLNLFRRQLAGDFGGAWKPLNRSTIAALPTTGRKICRFKFSFPPKAQMACP